MHLEVTFKHLTPRPEVRRRAEALFGKLERFLDPSAEGALIVRREHGAFVTELTVSGQHGVHQVHAEHDDLRTALDKTFHRIETPLRRAKEKSVDRRHKGVRAEVEDGLPPVREAAEDDFVETAELL